MQQPFCASKTNASVNIMVSSACPRSCLREAASARQVACPAGRPTTAAQNRVSKVGLLNVLVGRTIVQYGKRCTQ